MFGWGSTAPVGERVHPPWKSLAADASNFGPLEPADLEWTCAGGFVTETQTFYVNLPDGRVLSIQIIHSAVGLWYPQIQTTFGIYDTSDPKAGKRTWRSVNVTNFVTAPAPNLDKRSVKSDQISVTLDPKKPDTYSIRGTWEKDAQVSLEVSRLPGVPGWKLGAGPRGGMTYFGTYKPPKEGAAATGVDGSGGSDGYAIHRFWPRCAIKGVISFAGNVIELDPATCRGMFVHAIQGMRPNLLASRWAFADFQSSSDDGVSLVSMQFTTPTALGSKTVNIGSVVVDDKLVAISCGDSSDPAASGTSHDDAVLDVDTGYKAPYTLNYRWRAPAIDGKKGDEPVVASIKHSIRRADAGKGEGAKYASVGLIEKVDILAEMPALIKKIVHATGTQPYIYQWLNTVEATISLPAIGDKPARTLHPKGQLFCEASYVSETP